MVDAGPAEGVVDVARQLGSVAEQEPRKQRGRRGRQGAPNGCDRLVLDPHRPRRPRIVQRGHRIGACRSQDEDAVARELRRVVVGPGISKAGGATQPVRQ